MCTSRYHQKLSDKSQEKILFKLDDTIIFWYSEIYQTPFLGLKSGVEIPVEALKACFSDGAKLLYPPLREKTKPLRIIRKFSKNCKVQTCKKIRNVLERLVGGSHIFLHIGAFFETLVRLNRDVRGHGREKKFAAMRWTSEIRYTAVIAIANILPQLTTASTTYERDG